MILETYTRVFVEGDQLESTVSYISLLNGEKTLQFAYPEAGSMTSFTF
jgi:hypothetical protein